MTSREMVDLIKTMPETEVLEALQDNNFIVRTAAIWETVRRRITSKTAEVRLRELTWDTESFWEQFLVCDFAEAALDILKIESYQGNKDTVRMLIQSGLDF